MSASAKTDPNASTDQGSSNPTSAEHGTKDHSAKVRLLDILDEQPADCTYDDVLRELAFYRLVRRGLRGLGERRIATEEIRQRVKTWYG